MNILAGGAIGISKSSAGGYISLGALGRQVNVSVNTARGIASIGSQKNGKKGEVTSLAVMVLT
jgi:hypothetical protein